MYNNEPDGAMLLYAALLKSNIGYIDNNPERNSMQHEQNKAVRIGHPRLQLIIALRAPSPIIFPFWKSTLSLRSMPPRQFRFWRIKERFVVSEPLLTL